MRNPFRGSGKSYNGRTPNRDDPYGYTTTSRSSLSSNKLKILAGIVTFIVIILIMSESAVVVQAGHRGVVLYVGAVENR
ncbi:MAG: hypothetical protein JO297_16050, partial [Nitrososphaeraceae archaeon]|nr:hypothetical protein [Nitrososphaeraceae archaeon]MBV9178538.1 hypothetical protein [Nitrososphaeraceae archaeon]